MKSSAPAHITGFFGARRNPDPAKAGSIGAGLNLEMRAKTNVRIAKETTVFLNGVRSLAPVSMEVLKKLAPVPVRVETELSMPQGSGGSGFGASGAGALSCAYSLNQKFNLGLTANGAGQVAHMAEVVCGTGLGDVIAQNTGGLVVRLAPGAPGVGIVDRIPVLPLKVDCLVKGPLSTEEVLSDPKIMKEANREGEKALKALLQRPTIENFMILSWKFTRESGLARDWMYDVVKAVEASGGMASMVMLGDAVFALGGDDVLAEFEKLGDHFTTRISLGGAGLE